MSSVIMNSWSEQQAALDQLFALAERELAIYDRNLERFKLDDPARITMLTRLLTGDPNARLRIAVRDARHFRNHSPRLVALLRDHGHHMMVQETPENLAHLRDSMILADDHHALVVFDQDQPRCKLILDDPAATRPYLRRFDDLWQEGGTPVSPSVLGL